MSAGRLLTFALLVTACGGGDADGEIGAGGAAGSDGAPENACPAIEAISPDPAEALLGQTIQLSAQVSDTDRSPAPASYSWTSSSGTLSDASSSNARFTCTEQGEVTITLEVSDGECGDRRSVTVSCSVDVEPVPPAVKLNEIESSDGASPDWVELYNSGTTAADISGWLLKDNDTTHVYTLPSGSVLAAGAFLVLERETLGFELDSADSVRLFDDAGRSVDSFEWSSDASVTYGRCPDGTGAFADTARATKAGANQCAPVTTDPLPWPGPNDVRSIAPSRAFGGNLSGLTYRPATQTSPAVLWAVRNNVGSLYRLVFDGTNWIPDAAAGWGSGRPLRYPGATGNPDAEGVTAAEHSSSFLFVASERDNGVSSLSRPSVLRYDTGAADSVLNADLEWNLTGDLPPLGANAGIEAITWVPDSYLVAKSLFDEFANHTYDPNDYPDHGSGLFLVGVEASGLIHAYALDQLRSAFRRIATFSSGHPAVMSLEFDRELGYLWAGCDDTCGNALAILDIDDAPGSAGFGRFYVRRRIAPPSTLPNLNNEGIAFAPQAECVSGFRRFFWTDDGETDGYSLRADAIPCGPFL